MRAFLVQKDGTFYQPTEMGEVTGFLRAADSLAWLDICDPDDDDVALLREGFGFHPLAIEDAIRSHERPKVDTYTDPPGQCGSYYFLVFYAASYNERENQIDTQAINMFIGANYVVSIHVGESPDISDTLERWRSPLNPLTSRCGTLVHALLDALVDDYFPLMDKVADQLEDLEDAIFVEFDRDAIQTIFGLKKSLLATRRVVAPERDVLNVLLRSQLPIFGPEDTAYLQDVYDHIVRLTDNIDTYRDLLSSALDSYLSLQSNNLNQIIKGLTLGSIILMTDALIVGFYGMNFRAMPELDWRIGHLWAVFLMVISNGALVLYFRHKKWF